MYINVPRKVVLAIIVIRENCKDINVPGKVVLAIIVIRESCKVHKRSWEGSHGPACHAACNKRELYINVTGKDVLAIIVIRETCT